MRRACTVLSSGYLLGVLALRRTDSAFGGVVNFDRNQLLAFLPAASTLTVSCSSFVPSAQVSLLLLAVGARLS